jgi:hypothetical protein
MPKRASDANTRMFFDELVSIAASRLKATGVIALEDPWAVTFGEQTNSSASLRTFSKTAARGPSTTLAD